MGESDDLNRRGVAARVAVERQIGTVREGFGRSPVSWKPDGTRVTDADIAVSEGIFADLNSDFPEDQFFSEESVDSGRPIPVASRFCWVLDPIDGTNNFAVGIPYCAISLGLLQDGVPVYGVIYDYARDCLMAGGPGLGFDDAGRPASCFSGSLDENSLLGVQSPFDKSLVPQVEPVLRHFKVRGLGSGALHLAYVANGLFQGAVDHNVKVWDIAAACALCAAGGAEIRFLNGEAFPLREFDLNMSRIHYVAGNPGVCELLEKLVRSGENSG